MSEEVKLISSFVGRWGTSATGIGDDAAILTLPPGEKLVVSTDTSVENVHFRRRDVSAKEIGYRAAAAALSDLAAMAASPRGLLFALTLPASWRDDAVAIADGVGDAARDANCPIIGGNVTGGEVLSITTTVLGTCARPLTRSGAKPGDSLYVTGTLGGAAAAVETWASGRHPAPECRKRFVRPSPRILEGVWMSAQGATAAIDVSDGVVADAARLAEQSSVEISIEVETLPLEACTSPEHALSGGEDYELLVTAPALNVDDFQRLFGIPLTRIGRVSVGPKRVRVMKGGSEIAAPPGFDHLAPK